jgi:hypothetical protein
MEWIRRSPYCFSGVISFGAPISFVVYFFSRVAIIFPLLSSVFGMLQDVPDEQFLSLVVNPGNQPATVIGNIEHHRGSNPINTSPSLPDFRKVFPLRVLCHLVPHAQQGFPFTVLDCGFANLFRLMTHTDNLRIL